jgi:hypothetical protein
VFNGEQPQPPACRPSPLKKILQGGASRAPRHWSGRWRGRASPGSTPPSAVGRRPRGRGRAAATGTRPCHRLDPSSSSARPPRASAPGVVSARSRCIGARGRRARWALAAPPLLSAVTITPPSLWPMCLLVFRPLAEQPFRGRWPPREALPALCHRSCERSGHVPKNGVFSLRPEGLTCICTYT